MRNPFTLILRPFMRPPDQVIPAPIAPKPGVRQHAHAYGLTPSTNVHRRKRGARQRKHRMQKNSRRGNR